MYALSEGNTKDDEESCMGGVKTTVRVNVSYTSYGLLRHVISTVIGTLVLLWEAVPEGEAISSYSIFLRS